MDFTENSIPVESVMKFIMKSANEIHSEIHDNPKARNEKHMLFMKSGAFHFSCVFHFSVAFTFQACFSCAFQFSCDFHFSGASHFSGVLFSFHVLFTKSTSFHIKSTTFHETNKTRSIWVYTCTILNHTCTTYHHQIPPKYKIYLAGFSSVLYKTPGHNERYVLNEMFCCFSCAFHRKCWFSWRKYHISWKSTKQCQYMCIHVPFTHTCTTKYHQNMIYLVGLPSVLYERPGQKWKICVESAVLLFFWCFS